MSAQTTIIKILLTPLSLVYGLGVATRNFFYKTNIFRSIKFDVPIISVGNLSVGGAGKSPHIEYLIALLEPYLHVATLSRGYKRQTTGFLIVQINNNAEQVGDEPLQFKRKFPEATIAVAENRALAIPQLLRYEPNTQVILLDDAFQHRAVTPGLNILLTEYNNPFTRDFLLPAGRLREWQTAAKRADIIIITKCPPKLTPKERDEMLKEIAPLAHQKAFFSYYDYKMPYSLLNDVYGYVLNYKNDVLLVSGIARTDYLLNYLKETVNSVQTLEYEDHHYFNEADMEQIKKTYNEMTSQYKIILTTEKDATRLELFHEFIQKKQLPVYILPVKVAFHFSQQDVFEQEVKQFLLNFI